MKWDTVRFCQDYRIRYTLGKKWHQTDCVFCDDASLKAGFSLGGGIFSCFKCGSHDPTLAVSKMLMCSLSEAQGIVDSYKGSLTYQVMTEKQINASMVDLPGRKKMRKNHRKYLENRGFDPDELVNLYKLRFVGPEDFYWRHRIIFPIFYKGELVSFQGRDVTKKEGVIRYLGARQEDSIRHYKKLLYGAERTDGRTAVAVEGIFDYYNMGPGFVCTFGTSLTSAQIALLSDFEKVIFLFDPDDDNAWKKAKKYVLELRTLGVKAERIRYDGGDPGSLSRNEVRYIRKYIGFGV